MYQQCPKCNYQRTAADTVDPGICPSCGLVFAKWVQYKLGTRTTRGSSEAPLENGDAKPALFAWLTAVEDHTDPVVFWGRVALFAVFFVWGWYFIWLDFRTNDIGHSFLHRVNLVFHEAGHVVFMPFGNFLMVLGGTMGQLIMPLVVMTALVVKNRDNFGGSIGLWWFGQSLMDCAPYINDARDLRLMLLGGGTGEDRPGTHDWENILLDLSLIQHERKIAWMADAFGSLIVIVALIWGGYVLCLQYKRLKRDS
jgi:hypothetical protein